MGSSPQYCGVRGFTPTALRALLPNGEVYQFILTHSQMDHKEKRQSTVLKLLRPLFHFWIILLIFYLIYRLRLVTDLIPGLQLPIPAINYNETMVFAIISGLAFVAIWILKNLYELNKPVEKYFQTFTKVRIYRIITITFVSYFGTWFVFKYWLSRFIIIVWY